MPAKRTTDIIKSIERKKGLFLVKTEDWSASLSLSFFSEELLYVGKELSHNDKIRLSHYAALSEPLDYAHRLLAKKMYSAHQMREKIQVKYPECEDINEIIFRLKKEGLLDDRLYAEAYKESKEAQLFGREKILNELRFVKGVNPEILSELEFAPEDGQLEKLFPLLDRKYMDLPYRKKVAKIQKILIDRGYSSAKAAEYASKSNVDEKMLDKRFQADLEKAKRLYGRKYEGYELSQRIIRSLLSKGYTMNKIMEAL